MGAVYMLSLRQLATRGRIAIMLLLAALPVLVAWLSLADDHAPSLREFESTVFAALHLGAITPLVVLALAAVAFGNEIEDRTLANLTLAPLPRWKIILPKLLAAVTIGAVFTGASAIVTGQMAYLAEPRAMLAMTAGTVVAVAVYAAVFVWLGLASSQAVGIGLAYIVLWEGFVAGFVNGVRLLSIRYYAMALIHGMDARRFASLEHPAAMPAALVLALMFGAFLWLAVRRLKRMDVP